jgi:hypothetical protein
MLQSDLLVEADRDGIGTVSVDDSGKATGLSKSLRVPAAVLLSSLGGEGGGFMAHGNAAPVELDRRLRPGSGSA